MRLESPEIASAARPGQFVHVEAPGRTLRRAFSISGSDGDSHISIVFRVYGHGTGAISRVARGESVDILGPLGRGFPDPSGPPLFVAGGLGAAPLSFMASATSGGMFLYGAMKECEFIPDDLLSAGNHRLIKVCQEKTGTLVTEKVKDHLAGAGQVYAAGPRPMLKRLTEVCSGRVKTYVSWEEAMGCGTGLCQGCPVKTATGYMMTCSDGPVFNADEIDWDAC